MKCFIKLDNRAQGATHYIPGYLDGIQDELKTIIAAAERAADYIENGPTYQNRMHPFHAASVSTYNRIISVILDVQSFIVSE